MRYILKISLISTASLVSTSLQNVSSDRDMFVTLLISNFSKAFINRLVTAILVRRILLHFKVDVRDSQKPNDKISVIQF